MKIFHLILRRLMFSSILMLCLITGQAVLPQESGLSYSAFAKTGVSSYKKSFKRSKRISSKKSRKRGSRRSCVKWNANEINEKARKFNPYINQYARQYRIDRNLIKAVITAESCFKVKALSHAGAQGLMQLIPATAKRFGVKNSYKPQQNIRGGTKYLRFLMDRFKGDLKKVIASYNAGEGAVDRYKGIPPYKETKQYVKNVLKVYAVLNPRTKKKIKPVNRVKAVYQPPKFGNKAGRQGWQYNRSLAPHLYKQ